MTVPQQAYLIVESVRADSMKRKVDHE